MKRALKWSFLIFLFLPVSLFAAEGKINTGNTAWMLVSTALVMMMTPAGLAMFYGGMTRSKNMLNTLGMSLLSYAIASILWVIYLYSLIFHGNIGGFIGDLGNFFMSGIGVKDVTGTIPTFLFAAFQMTFAGITIALVSGSVVERTKFSWWLVFAVLWLTFVYAPVAHWVWGGGFLAKMGALDFAGGTVVHINAGVTGLILALLIGKRKGFGKTAFFPSSTFITALGAAFLWFGWFGFNAGSELAADGVAVNAFLVTNTSAAIATVTWVLVEWAVEKKPTILGAASGAVAGLVAITPAAGFVNVVGALIIGFFAAIFGFLGVTMLKNKFGYDDSLDAFGVHGIDGMWGALATGLFADPAISGHSGWFYGNAHQFLVQLISVVITVAFAAILSVILAYIAKTITAGWRVEEESETMGLDQATHGERGFELF